MTSANRFDLRCVRRTTQGRRGAFAALVVAIIVILVAAPEARQAPGLIASTPSGGPSPALDAPTDVDLLVGRSTVLNVGSAIARVSLTVPDVADAMVTAPGQLLIHGKQPGTISLFVWDRAGAIRTYEVKVRRDLTPLHAHLRQLFPGEPITAMGSGKDVVLSGTVSGQYVIDKAASVAAGYVEKKENVVNLLRQQEGVASNQVMLRVRFAEVSRSAVMELGASLFTGPTGYKDWIARSTTQQFAAPNYTDMERTADLDDNLTSAKGKYSLSDYLNIFVFNNKYNIGTVVRALQEKGLFQSLAEPNLIATNGKEASFLAGGEYPYPVVQGGGNMNSVTIMFKEFGIRLNFTPTVLGGDLINLKVRPEVSSLDFANAVTVSGFRVPALSTRRTETEVELRDGQTFAIAGLMNNTVQDSMRKIPGIGDIPILGWLFKSKAMQKAQTELVVMITPTIVRRGTMGVSEALPSLVEPYMEAPKKSLPNPDPYIGSPRYPANQAAPMQAPVQTPAQVPAMTPAPAQAPVAPAPQQQAEPAPLPSRPVDAPASHEAGHATPEQSLTKEQLKALERAREQERKAALEAEKVRVANEKKEAERARVAAKAEEKRRADQARKDAEATRKADEAARKAEEARKLSEKLDKERTDRLAEEEKAREKRESDDQEKRDKALNDAAARLKQAQDEYQREVARSSGAGAEKPKPAVFAPRQ